MSLGPTESSPLLLVNGFSTASGSKLEKTRHVSNLCFFFIGAATLVLAILALLLSVFQSLPRIPPLSALSLRKSRCCSKAGPSPCIIIPTTKRRKVDPSRPNFAARIADNLILYDDFHSERSLIDLWQPEVTLGDGNGGFAYYTALPTNVAVEDGALRLRPGLFADLGDMQKRIDDISTGKTIIVSYHAADVMTGNCTPFPACATFHVPNCTCSEFAGCTRIGTPLVTLNPATSGRVSTRGTFDFTYGRLEARMRLPQGDWLWPALWLMPSEALHGSWPDSGEIDLVEARGNAPGVIVGGGQKAGRDTFVTSLHYAGNCWWHTQRTVQASSKILQECQLTQKMNNSCDFSQDFFTFGLFWSDRRMYTYILNDKEEEQILWDIPASAGFGPDDVPMGCHHPPGPRDRDQNEATTIYGSGPYVNATNKNAPFDRPFYIILNIAVGGEQSGCPSPNFWGEHAVWCVRRDPSRPDIAASTLFWNARNEWLPTWDAAKAAGREAFVIDWIKVWQ